MKTTMSNSSLILILAGCCIIFVAGCASMQTAADTPSLLSQAGFRAHPPQTAKQKELYATLPSNRLEHATMNGNERYAFKDEKAGAIYFGGESEHQQYQQLCRQQHVALAPEEKANQSLFNQWKGGVYFGTE
jgi:hypothetical protein